MNEQWVIQKITEMSPSPTGDYLPFDPEYEAKDIKIGEDSDGIYILADVDEWTAEIPENDNPENNPRDIITGGE